MGEWVSGFYWSHIDSISCLSAIDLFSFLLYLHNNPVRDTRIRKCDYSQVYLESCLV